MSTPDTIIEINLDDLHESQIYDEEALRQLAVDIRVHGRVLQPLLVRPRIGPLFGNDPEAATGFEVVFGHRRLRGARMAELATVHCMVRAMTDDEAKHAQISENLARSDVHPIEEAEGFQALMAPPSQQSADDIAMQFGKSRSYVYGRLKLLQAIPSVRKACLEKRVDAEVALLIARLGKSEYQEKALEYIKKDDWRAGIEDGGKASYRSIRALLNEKFALDLKDAIFDTTDPMLLPGAQSCLYCLKRTGNAPEFADVVDGPKRNYRSDDGLASTGENVCTDPDCFGEKKKAHLKREAARLEEKGKTVVQGNKARAAIDAHGNVKGGFIKLADVKAVLKEAAAKGKTIEVITIQDPRDGKTHQVVKADDAKAAGIKVKAVGPSQHSPAYYEAERKKREEQHAKDEVKAKAETTFRLALLDRVRTAAAGVARSTFDLQMIATMMWEHVGWGSRRELIASLHGLKPNQVEKRIGSMDAGTAAQLLLDCAIVSNIKVDAHQLHTKPERLLEAAKHYGLDINQVRAELAEPAPTPSAAAQAPAGATKKSAAGAGAKKASSGKAPVAKPAKTKRLPLQVAGDPNAPDDSGLAAENGVNEAGSAGTSRHPDLFDRHAALEPSHG